AEADLAARRQALAAGAPLSHERAVAGGQIPQLHAAAYHLQLGMVARDGGVLEAYVALGGGADEVRALAQQQAQRPAADLSDESQHQSRSRRPSSRTSRIRRRRLAVSARPWRRPLRLSCHSSGTESPSSRWARPYSRTRSVPKNGGSSVLSVRGTPASSMRRSG